MNLITTTGVSMLLFALGFLVGGKNFSNTLKNISSNNQSGQLGKLLALHFLVVGLQNAVIGIGSELFYQDDSLIKFILILSNILLTIHAAIAAWILANVFFSNYVRRILVLFVAAAGIFLSVLPLFYFESPEIDSGGQLNMNLPIPLSLLIFFMIFVSGFSISYIFVRIYSITKTKKTKYFSLGVAILIWLSVISAFLRVVIYGSRGIPDFVDTLFSFIGILLVVIFISPPLFQRLAGVWYGSKNRSPIS